MRKLLVCLIVLIVFVSPVKAGNGPTVSAGEIITGPKLDTVTLYMDPYSVSEDVKKYDNSKVVEFFKDFELTKVRTSSESLKNIISSNCYAIKEDEDSYLIMDKENQVAIVKEKTQYSFYVEDNVFSINRNKVCYGVSKNRFIEVLSVINEYEGEVFSDKEGSKYIVYSFIVEPQYKLIIKVKDKDIIPIIFDVTKNKIVDGSINTNWKIITKNISINKKTLELIKKLSKEVDKSSKKDSQFEDLTKIKVNMNKIYTNLVLKEK